MFLCQRLLFRKACSLDRLEAYPTSNAPLFVAELVRVPKTPDRRLFLPNGQPQTILAWIRPPGLAIMKRGVD
jgi:hypothetical protein